jgi:hypothetical protein
MHWWDRLQPVNARLRAHFFSPSEMSSLVFEWDPRKARSSHRIMKNTPQNKLKTKRAN